MSLQHLDLRTPPRPSRATELPFRPIDAEAVRAYDIRGVAGRQVTRAGVRALGLGYATLARSRGLSRIGVGRDGRLSSPGLERALVMGLTEGGMQVVRIGLGPTPKLGFAVRTLGLDGGLMVTASHNPPGENGLKVLLGAERIHGEALKALVASQGRPAPGGSVADVEIGEAYVTALAAAAGGLHPMSVAWDCGNGATGEAVEALARRLPGRHILLNTRIDGRFPAHHPDPAVAENLAQLGEAVRAHGCDLGLAFDGDGDRIGVVDETGAQLCSDHLLLLLARELLDRRPGAAIVGDVKSSRLLFDGVQASGGQPVMAPSGYVLVREAMKRHGALLGGELSGHIFFADGWDGTDDALYAAVRVLQALGRMGRTLGGFRRDLPESFATPELRLHCPRAQETVRKIAALNGAPAAAFDPAMGVRAERPGGWWLVRASGTEPKITCRCEADSEAALGVLKRELWEMLRQCGVDASA
jgi:phosphomannomutase